MIHHYIDSTESGNHWAVASQAQGPAAGTGRILVQVQENGVPARISLTPEQAVEMATCLMMTTSLMREAEAAQAKGGLLTEGHIQFVGATRDGMSENLTVAFSHEALRQHTNRLGTSGSAKQSK